MKAIFLESLLVALVGALLAFGANAVSNRGLALRENYFDTGNRSNVNTSSSGGSHSIEPGSPLELLAAQGIRTVDSNQVVALFHDPRLEQGLVAFIDARNDEEYQAGHIPDAWQFDRYHAANYLSTLLPVCQLAQEVVVYCNGGSNCEESAFAATFLVSAGVPKEKLSVYVGGITEWTNRMPVELGQRNSGQVAGAVK